ncbi:hypothetical protein QBC43DRAFT_315761 [Cladorrhinum sp. PSN259]|nr:hypothetical protein QBC43DRAFT_315761 [Cladorrhinum sp. PSN259]
MELTSSLTTLPSLSPPASFYTALHSVPADSDDNEADTTTMTTPDDDDDCIDEDACYDSTHRYRRGIEPPFELKHSIQIHLEEQLYSQAITLLEGLLSDSTKTSVPARIATPSQIAFLSTMAIHPHFTSRPSEGGRRSDGNRALAYLRGLVSTVGPLNANFKQAFSFQSKNNVRAAAAAGGRHRKKVTIKDDDEGSSSGWGGASDSDSVTCPFARDELVWLRAQNFWSVLGWSFRCAALHPARWKFWSGWLNLVIVEVVEKDWDERLRMDKEEVAGSESEVCKYPRLRDSIFVAWLEDLRNERKNVLKDVMKALLAFTVDDSGDKVVFREIFDRETVVGPRKLKKRRADTSVLDLENNLWGDYMDVEESESEEPEGGGGQSLPVLRRGRGKPAAKDGGAAAFRLTDGIAETIRFRLRLFRLLSAAAHYLPDMKFFSTTHVYQSFSDMVRNLPLPLFPLFMDADSDLPDFIKVSLYRNVAEDLLPQNRPDPDDIDKETNDDNGISTDIMEHCFLPFAASRITAEDNAKLSIVLENMMWVLVSMGEIEDTMSFKNAIEVGIRARENKVKKKGAAATTNSKANGPEKLARDMLERSSRNLKLFANMLVDY